jgi:hypothetical protein
MKLRLQLAKRLKKLQLPKSKQRKLPSRHASRSKTLQLLLLLQSRQSPTLSSPRIRQKWRLPALRSEQRTPSSNWP